MFYDDVERVPSGTRFLKLRETRIGRTKRMTNANTGLKVAHFAAFGPGRSGQYATVRDLILAERKLGVDAQFIDCAVCPKCNKNEGCAGKEDGEIVTETIEWAMEADVLVRHSVIPIELEEMGIPIILCLHGRPENSFLLQKYGQMPIYSFMRQVAEDERYKAVVTFWSSHIFYLRHLMPEQPIMYVPPMVDLEQYKPEGPKRNYSSRKGNPNIMIADIWREDTTPFNVLFAATKFVEKYANGGRIHQYGIPGGDSVENIIVSQLSKAGVLGDVCTLMPNMAEQYRAADFLITPHVIATRVVREAAACGCPIVAGSGNPYTPFTGNPRDVDGFAAAMNEAWKSIQDVGPEKSRFGFRSIAEREFDPVKSGEAMIKVFEKVLSDQKSIKISYAKEDDKITFAFSAFGDEYINNVFVLLQSIDSVYGGRANVIFYYSNIDPGYIDEIKEILPYVVVKEAEYSEAEAGDAEYKTAQKSIIWKEILDDNPNLENVVLMDADMMIVRKMGKFFAEDEFDIGFCYKERDDENIHWPVNGGIMLVRNSEMVRSFLGEWAKLTIETQKAGKQAKEDGYQLWGGGDQVSLGRILGTRDPEKYKRGLDISTVKFQGFPMKYINESRGIIPTGKTHVIHYKGAAWQNLLKLGVFSKRRPSITCQTLYDLNIKVLNKWRERRFQVMGKWSPDFEMKYWVGHEGEHYIKDTKRLYDKFSVDKVVEDNLTDENIRIVVEIGGGAYGGALRFFKKGIERYSIDLAMDRFAKMDQIPLGINCIKSDFSNIPINSGCADVVFAWEVLDHALTQRHFDKGIDEICRIMKPGGILFLNHPIREKQKNGHHILVPVELVIGKLKNNGMDLLDKKMIDASDVKYSGRGGSEINLIMKKRPPQKVRVPDDVASLISKVGD